MTKLVTYVFEGDAVPTEFFEDVYSNDRGVEPLKVLLVDVTNYGDDIEVTVQGTTQEVIDERMKYWALLLKK